MTPDDLKAMSKDANNFKVDTGTLRGHIDTLTDYIEDELWPKIKELEARVIRWIPVSEKLPEKQDIYLVYDPSVYGVESDFWEIPSHGFPPRFLRLGETVTHWASRPPSPEEGK